MTVDILTEGRMVDIVAEGFVAGLRASSRVSQDMIRVPMGALEVGSTGDIPPLFAQAAGADLVYIGAEPPKPEAEPFWCAMTAPCTAWPN